MSASDPLDQLSDNPFSDDDASFEVQCPKCGRMSPPACLRCRDCGAFFDPELEKAYFRRVYGDAPEE
jgi:hypothetical protein